MFILLFLLLVFHGFASETDETNIYDGFNKWSRQFHWNCN